MRPGVTDLHIPDSRAAQVTPQRPFCLLQRIILGGQIKADDASGGSQGEGESGPVCLFLRLDHFPALHIAVGRVRPAVVGVIGRADPGVVQVGTHRLGELHPGLPMLHQPAAQLLVRGHALDELVPAQVGGDVQDIIQAVDALRPERPGKNLLGIQIHGVHQPGQPVQLLHAGFLVQRGGIQPILKVPHRAIAPDEQRLDTGVQLLQLLPHLLLRGGEGDRYTLSVVFVGNVQDHGQIPPIPCSCRYCSAGSSIIRASSVRLP